MVPAKPYYALYSYKLFHSDRFDLLGNSLAILTGIASPHRARNLVAWIEAECEAMRDRGELAVDLPPCLFPYILPHHADWRPRYERFNRPGEYHNGGVWPFVCGFYVAACVAAGRMGLAQAEAVGADRTGQAMARERGGVGFQRVDQGADRSAQRARLADLVGRDVPLRC